MNTKYPILLVVVGLTIWGCGCNDAAPDPKVETARPALQGSLVYQRGKGRKSEIWKMDLNSYKSVRLTNNDVLDEYPRWSPDGKYIAFYSDRDGTRQIYIMDKNGRNAKKVISGFPMNEDPTWSPDGKRLCFWAEPGEGKQENLFISSKNGGDSANITQAKRGTCRVPDWSPDGKRIVFTSNKFLNHQIYIIDSSGGNEHRLTRNPRGTCRARWSPDGERLAYSDAGYSLKKNVDIWEMDPDGKNNRRLTEDRGNDYDVAYSPDGTKIIFSSNRTGHYELYVMDRDGSNEIRLTRFDNYTRFPDWIDKTSAKGE